MGQTTAETNIYKYEVEQMREEARITEAGKKRPIPSAKTALPPHLCLNSRRYRALAIKWAMDTFPPMSNSKLVEEAGTVAVDAFNTVQERLSQDELTAEQEEESKTALDEILAIFQIVQKQEQER